MIKPLPVLLDVNVLVRLAAGGRKATSARGDKRAAPAAPWAHSLPSTLRLPLRARLKKALGFVGDILGQHAQLLGFKRQVVHVGAD